MVVSAAAFFVAPSPATATLINYTLTPPSGATATFPSGTINLTGTFTLDTSGPALVQVDITAITTAGTVFTLSPEVFNTPDFTDGNGNFIATNLTTGDGLELNFLPDLIGSPALPLISGVQKFRPGDPSNVLATSFAGGAVLTPTPEPASFTLLGGALALFLFARRRDRRDRRA
jgi:hypothetical protein